MGINFISGPRKWRQSHRNRHSLPSGDRRKRLVDRLWRLDRKRWLLAHESACSVPRGVSHFSSLIGVAMTADHLLSANLVGRMWREAILLSFAFDYESATKVNLLDYFVREAMAATANLGHHRWLWLKVINGKPNGVVTTPSGAIRHA
jgi:hypothetical protein